MNSLYLIFPAIILSDFISCVEEETFKYRTYKEISDYLIEIQKAHNETVEQFIIGHSVEGRPIPGIRISKGKIVKPTVFLDAGIHAREWVAPVVALHTIKQLLETPKNADLVDKLNWYILPMLNPDGYVYSMESSRGRLWRKNRARTFNAACDGVDLNRNFGFAWGGPGSSDNPCDATYRGPYPYSEPEVTAFAQFFISRAPEIQMYLTLHSAASAILYPWGYTDILPPDWLELDALGRRAAMEINRFNGTKYVVGSTTSLVGVGAGGSDDWAKGSVNIKYVYTIELPGFDHPQHGFHPSEEALPSISQEAFQGIRAFAKSLFGFQLLRNQTEPANDGQ